MGDYKVTKYEELQQHLYTNQYSWLITGVAGFIGSNLLEKLLILNQKVIGLDNFETGHQDNIDKALQDVISATGEDKRDNFTFIKGDIKKLKDCQLACQTTDYVLHQAALGSVPRSVEDPIRTNQANIDGFLNMLVAARDAKIKRFVYAASSSTYGDHTDLPKVEDKIGNPLSPYAVTKLVNEHYAEVFAKTYNFNSIGLRYFNIFGKRQDPNGSYAAIIPKWTEALIKGKELFINGDGETSRDFCYIGNAIQMNLLAASTVNPEASNQVYNVGHNQRTTLNELYELIKERVDVRRTESEFPASILSYRNFRAGDVRHSQADITKARILLNYQPTQDIKQGLDEAIDWYVSSLSKENFNKNYFLN
jgi:UDP-N-acetylglucosamine/UDP-N-acetylgalactosamine 4-epimerase